MRTELVVHVKHDPFDVYIGRPNRRAGLGGSVWANPFRIGDPHPRTGAPITRHEAIQLYKQWIVRGDGRHLSKRLGELEGKTLGCWCAGHGGVGAREPLVCHGQILLLLLEHRRRVIERKKDANPPPDEDGSGGHREAPSPERYIFFGSRGWDDATIIREQLQRLGEGAVVVTGGARGADRIAERLARRMGFTVEVYPARWEREGKGAGYRRNERMRDLPGVRGAYGFRVAGKSNGTDHMSWICREAGIETTVQPGAKPHHLPIQGWPPTSRLR